MGWRVKERHIVLDCPYMDGRTFPPTWIIEPSYVIMEWTPDDGISPDPTPSCDPLGPVAVCDAGWPIDARPWRAGGDGRGTAGHAGQAQPDTGPALDQRQRPACGRQEGQGRQGEDADAVRRQGEHPLIRCYIDPAEPQAVRDEALRLGYTVCDDREFTIGLETLHHNDRFIYPQHPFDGGEFIRLGNDQKVHNLATFTRD